VFFAFVGEAALVEAADFAFVAGAGAAWVSEPAGGVAGAAGFASAFVAFLSTPPWPPHAPLPLFDVEPSLQMTVSSVPGEGCADGADEAPADFVLAFAAFLSTPPWPLHAPLPLFDVEPSLQMTVVGASAADRNCKQKRGKSRE
jgi:hypothetical protein